MRRALLWILAPSLLLLPAACGGEDEAGSARPPAAVIAYIRVRGMVQRDGVT